MIESEFRDQQANVLMRQKEWDNRYMPRKEYGTVEHLPPYEDSPLSLEQLYGGPWDTFDRVCGWGVSIFAAIGFSVTVGVAVGFIWGYFK